MRIALFTETFLPKVDGVVNTLCHLLDHLAARGHHSVLFAPKDGPTRYAHTPVVGLLGFPFPLYPELRLVPPRFDMKERLVAFQPDLIHVLNPFSLGLVGLWVGKELGVPVVASYHTDVPGYAVRWGLGVFRDALWNYIRWMHSQADLNLCPSTYTMNELKAQGIERLKVWGRGVDTTRFHPCRRDPEWRWRLSGGQPDAPLLLYVGRLSMEKRVEWLRSALEATPGARLAIVGDGPLRPTLEAHFAGTPTVFTGYLWGHDLARAYAAADIFLFPSANETLGNVVLEAMASGLPVVAPNSGGLTDHVREGQTGLLIPTDDREAFVGAARRMVENLDWARRLGAAGRERVEHQTWPLVLDGLLDDYAALVEREQPREMVAA